MLFRNRLTNDNIFIWFGTFDEDLINNCLILAGGDVFVLMGISKIELKPQFTDDLQNLSIQEFIDKYNLVDFESIEKEIKERKINKESYKSKIYQLVEELKKGVRNGIYPPFMTDYEIKVEDVKDTIRHYLNQISNSMRPEESIGHLQEIIDNCEERIRKLRNNKIKNEENFFKKLKKISKSPNFDELLRIQKEIDWNIRNLGRKIRTSLEIFEEFKNQLKY